MSSQLYLQFKQNFRKGNAKKFVPNSHKNSRRSQSLSLEKASKKVFLNPAKRTHILRF